MNSNVNMSYSPPGAAGIPNKIPTRFIVLAGEKIHAYKTSTDMVEEYNIAKDMYFTDEDIIPQPGGRINTDIRIALNKGDWTWMDVHYSSIRKIQLYNVNPSLDDNVDQERKDFTKAKSEQLERMMEEQARRLHEMQSSLDNIQNTFIPKVVVPKAPPQTQPKIKNDDDLDNTVNKLIDSHYKKWKDLTNQLNEHEF